MSVHPEGNLEQAMLDWLTNFGWQTPFGPRHLAAGCKDPGTESDSYRDVVCATPRRCHREAEPEYTAPSSATMRCVTSSIRMCQTSSMRTASFAAGWSMACRSNSRRT